MEYGLNRLDEPVVMAGPKPMLLTEFAINQRLESGGLLPGRIFTEGVTRKQPIF